MIQLSISRFETAHKYRDGEQLKWGVIWRNESARNLDLWEAKVVADRFWFSEGQGIEEADDYSGWMSQENCIQWLEERLEGLEVVEL